jgi:ion channel-forming bestrophin family protein
MIVRDKPGIWELMFSVRGSVLPHIRWTLFAMTAIATAMVFIDHHFLKLDYANATPFALFGAALSLFLGFRNNAAYDRWWEARKLWGGLIVDIRSFAREVQIFVPDAGLHPRLLRLALAFVHLHRAQLRKLSHDPAAVAAAQAAGLAADATAHAALNQMAALIAAAHRAGDIDGFGARALAGRLASFEMQQASNERIASTPLPYVYSLLVFRTSYMYCLLLPLALIGPAGWLTPLFVGIVSYVFFGLAVVTEELAHPFGETLNALPLDALCRAAEISVAPHLGEPAPPARIPQDYYLS